MSDNRDPDFDAISEKDIFEEGRDRMQISLEADTHSRSDGKEAALFREGLNHWDDEVITTASQETPQLVINFTDTLVTRIVNNMAEREPRGKCHPIGDGANIERANILNGIGRHIETRSDAEVAYDNGADSAVTIGWGWWELLTEYASADSFDKEILIAPIMNTFSVYPDPSSLMPTASDMWWCLIVMDMHRTEYKRLYPRAENASWNGGADTKYLSDWETKETIRIARYFRIREKSDKLYRIRRADGSEFTKFKSDLPKPETLILAPGDQVVDERDSAKREVQLFYLNGTKVIERQILPGEYIPVIRCQGNARNIDGRVYRRGMVKTMMDPQRMVDYGEVAKIRRLGLAPQAPWVAAEGQLSGHPEWDSSNTTAHPVLVYKPVTVQTGQGEVPLPPPQRQPPAQIEAGFSEFVQGMRSNLLAIAGMPNEPGQDQQQGQTVSGVALQRRDRLSDQSHAQYYKGQSLAIAHTWRILVTGWIQAYYSKRQMQRIIGEDGKPSTVDLSDIKNDITVGRYDVVMDSGPSYETRREEGAANLIQLLSIQALAETVVKNGADLVFRSIDAPYMEELADRIQAQTPEGLKKVMEQLPKEARAVVQSMATQIQQLQQALKESQENLKFGITKAHLEATTKAHDTETRAETERFGIQVKAHTALATEEIRAGGKILDTHAKAGHDAAAADKMIEAAAKSENGAA